MSKRLALTIAGAVSLGSYEAGVLYELLRAIATHNDATRTDAERIYVDVITGASAGGMTAAMVSRRLMYDAASLDGEFTNSLYEAWVERISLVKLVRMHWKEKKWHSLFSSDLIESIGQDLLVKPTERPYSGPHAAIEKIDGVPQKLRVGIALTNLSGIDYMIPIAGSDEGGFNYTTSVDQKLFEVTANEQGNTAQWNEMCDAAVASGAFPAAFRPKALQRRVKEFGDELPSDERHWTQGQTYVQWVGPSPNEFAYSDGGVLQNQPLGIAKNLVDASVADREARLGPAARCDSDDRLYVFIAPHSVKSSARDLRAGEITIWDELKQLIHVYLRQATFHDWINAESINQEIRTLDERARELGDLIAVGELDAVSLRKASSDLNRFLMPNQEKARLDRLRAQYQAEYKKVVDAAGSDSAEAFISALATLEAAAHLENRDKMKIVAVIADEKKELAGSGLAAFVGFFKKSFRQHDYWVGRVKTRAYLQRFDVKRILGVTKWSEEDLWQTPLANPSGVTLPLSNFQIARAAIVPGIVMVIIRPVLVFILLFILLLSCSLGVGVWYLLQH